MAISSIHTAVHHHEIHLATGVRIHYTEYGDPAGDPIICLHGTSDSWLSFSLVLEHLDPAHHVFMLDHRGHGNSSRPETDYSIGDYAADVIAFMEALNLRQVTLVGHSMGSFIAQRIAVTAPERLARLVLIGSATKTYTDDLGEFQKATNMLEDPVPESFARNFQISTIYRPLPDGFLDQAVSESLKLPAHVWKAVVNGMFAADSSSPLEQIQAPTLIVWGDQDVIFSRSEQEALAARIPNAELRIYPQTGHALQWEQPEAFARDLEAFIASTVY